MKQEILRNLREIEKTRDVKILFACESGSRAWGFASSDSDYDVRFIYVHSSDWYLNLKSQKDTIEMMLENDLDFSGWDIRKALNLFASSNPSFLEWINSPIIYTKDDFFFEGIKKLSTEIFDAKKVCLSYLSIAKNHQKKYIISSEVKAKRLLYVLRSLLASEWILRYNKMPPTLFSSIYKNSEICPATLSKEIEKLIEIKNTMKEVETIKIPNEIETFISTSFNRISSEVENIGSERIDFYEKLNKFFRENLEREKNRI